MTTNSITVTEQERSLLDLIATAESGVHGYTAYYPGSNDPTITEKTLAQVIAFQEERIRNGVPSSAIGRYQFIKKTLNSAIDIAGLDRQRTRFTPIVQDHLILEVMKSSRGLNSWVAGTLDTPNFQLKLAQEFASVPVPFDTQGHKRFVKAGESYYAGDGLNAAGHRASAFIQALDDIRAGGTGQAFTQDIGTSGPSGAFPEQGQSARRIAETATAGGNRVTGGRRTSSIATTNPASIITLPDPVNVYGYNDIDPHDNRYDFRTGQIIRDIGINGFKPVSANTTYTPSAFAESTGSQTPGVASGKDIGQPAPQPASSPAQQSYSASNSPITDTNNPGFYDPRNGNVVPPPKVTPDGVGARKNPLGASRPSNAQ